MTREERKKRIEAMKRELEKRGALIHIDDRMPLEMTEQFLQEVLDCPDCGGGHGKGGH